MLHLLLMFLHHWLALQMGHGKPPDTILPCTSTGKGACGVIIN